jgi:hypothetical protein
VNLDVLYVAWNRREFTETTFPLLLENTDWSRVRRLHIHDDDSEDGAGDYLRDAYAACPVPVVFESVALRSPPAVMNRYVAQADAATWFAKIDSDIACPPGWLEALLDVLEDSPELDLLGMEGGRTGTPWQHFGNAAARVGDFRYSYEPARWIGGVGLFRTEAFASRPRMRENAGRDGLTHFQTEYGHDLTIGWVLPDVLCSCLDMIPMEPYASLSEAYVEAGWQRAWNELDRYLPACLDHLLGFVDAVAIVDDGSTDETVSYLAELGDRVRVLETEEAFFQHEGRARNRLLEWTLEQEPTHVLAIDADEFVSDGAAVRAACAGRQQVFSLAMHEVWQADLDELRIREDGGWRSHAVPCLYAVPPARWRKTAEWQIANRALACGREPSAVRRLYRKAKETGSDILHFGWTDPANRAARYERYVVADGGRFHASQHLRSIMWPDRQVKLRSRPWPPALEEYRGALVPIGSPA